MAVCGFTDKLLKSEHKVYLLLVLLLPEVSAYPQRGTRPLESLNAEQKYQNLDLLTFESDGKEAKGKSNVLSRIFSKYNNVNQEIPDADEEEGSGLKFIQTAGLFEDLNHSLTSKYNNTNVKAQDVIAKTLEGQLMLNDDEYVLPRPRELQQRRNKRDTAVMDGLSLSVGREWIAGESTELIHVQLENIDNETDVGEGDDRSDNSTLVTHTLTSASTTDAGGVDTLINSTTDIVHVVENRSALFHQMELLKDSMTGLEQRVRNLELWSGKRNKEEAEGLSKHKIIYIKEAFITHAQITAACHSVHAHSPRSTRVYQLLASQHFRGKTATVWLKEDLQFVQENHLDILVHWCKGSTHLTDVKKNCVVMTKRDPVSTMFCLEAVDCNSQQNVICLANRESIEYS